MNDVKRILTEAKAKLLNRAFDTEIAFFGGSFTAIDRKYMISLLEAAQPFLDKFSGIRISTRPDYIDDEVLSILKKYGVTSVELGAQSMNNEVLAANNRGHSCADVIKASKLIKQYGFSLGLQMMTGLYKATEETDIKTAQQFIELKPDTVRIYPTVVMRGTQLETLYNSSEYKTYSLEQSVELCSQLIELFYKESIPIIRLGLHYSDSLTENSVSDSYHPAFKELCEGRIFYRRLINEIKNADKKSFTVFINERSLSKFNGQKKCNVNTFKALGYNYEIKFDNSLGKYDLYIK